MDRMGISASPDGQADPKRYPAVATSTSEAPMKASTARTEAPVKSAPVESRPLLPRQAVQNSRIPPKSVGQRMSTLRLMTWNILAQSKALDSFPCAPPASLRAPSRGFGLVKEILRWEPDILCLQEVDARGVLSKEFFVEALGSNGYFLAGDAVKGNGHEGCCIFVRSYLRSSVGVKMSANLAETNQVAALVQICDGRGLDVLIGTTHLKAKKGNEDLRERQAADARELMDRSGQKSTARIFCGDFNAVSEEPAIKGMVTEGWRSAYGEVCKEEPYSTWKIRESGEVKRCIDYVWLKDSPAQRIWVESCVLPPHEKYVAEERFPSWQFPSDHVNLVVDLGLYSMHKP